MSIKGDLQRRADELWAYWEGLGARVNSIADVERIARRELMARYIEQGKAEVLVPFVRDADYDDHFNDIDTLATALAEQGKLKKACELWERVIDDLERGYQKNLRQYQRYIASPDSGDSDDINAARVELCERPRVALADAYDKYLTLLSIHATSPRAEKEMRARRSKAFAEGAPEGKAPADARALTEDVFWKLVEDARAAGASSDDRVEALRLGLRGFRPKEVLRFQKILNGLLRRANTWDLWGVAYVLNGGCSDDGFLYFRAWLILQGRVRYEKALADPESIARWADVSDEEPAEAEPLLYIAAEVYEDQTGEAAESAAVSTGKPRGQRWREEELPARFPRLWRRFGSP